MLARDFLNSEDSIFFSPRLCDRDKTTETWLFPHMNSTGESYNNLVHIVFDGNFAKIIVFSEDKLLESNDIQITKISNLIHDVCDEFKMKCITVDDIYDVDINLEMAKHI